MKTYRSTIKIMLLVCIISFLYLLDLKFSFFINIIPLLSIFSIKNEAIINFIYDLVIGINASSLVLLISSIILYYLTKRRTINILIYYISKDILELPIICSRLMLKDKKGKFDTINNLRKKILEDDTLYRKAREMMDWHGEFVLQQKVTILFLLIK